MRRKSKIIEIGTKAIVASIPYIGGAINSVMSDINANRKFKRFEEFIDELKIGVESLKEINKEYIKEDDFLDLFEQTSRYIMQERVKQKRENFKNILVNSMSLSDSDYDKTEKYLKILSDLSTYDLLLLKVLDNPQKYNESKGNIIPSNKSSNFVTQWKNIYMKELLEKLFPEIPIDEIEESALFLESNRLIVNNFMQYSLNTNGHPIGLLNNRLTNKGKDFLQYIKRK